jgi:hypothetical protein
MPKASDCATSGPLALQFFAEPMRVVDLYTLRDGKIARLETTLLTPRSG